MPGLISDEHSSSGSDTESYDAAEAHLQAIRSEAVERLRTGDNDYGVATRDLETIEATMNGHHRAANGTNGVNGSNGTNGTVNGQPQGTFLRITGPAIPVRPSTATELLAAARRYRQLPHDPTLVHDVHSHVIDQRHIDDIPSREEAAMRRRRQARSARVAHDEEEADGPLLGGNGGSVARPARTEAEQAILERDRRRVAERIAENAGQASPRAEEAEGEATAPANGTRRGRGGARGRGIDRGRGFGTHPN